MRYKIQAGADTRGRHRKEMIVERRGGSMEQGTGKGTRRVKQWRGHCQQRRKASLAAGEEGMKVGDMNQPREDQHPRQQGLPTDECQQTRR